jgi:vacuolar-type H+-ATPase subunit F/Vma7
MASKVVAIGRGNTALGLGLSGVAVERIEDLREAEDRLHELLDSDAEMVIVEEQLRDEFSEYMHLALGRHHGLPLVIFVPAFLNEEAGTQAYINAILKPAVGFEIRLD